MFRGVIFNRDKLVPRGPKRRRRCLEVGSGPPSAVLVYDPRFLDHVSSPFHVERPDRLRSIVSHLERTGLFIDVERAPPATLANLKRVHRETYLEYFQNLGEGLLDPETAVHPGTFDLGLLAAGAVLHGTRSAVRDGRPTVALVRPPGHHAGPDYGGGFCYRNHVALATRICASRFAVALEGGYHLDALGEVIAGVVAGLRGRSLSLGLSDVLDEKGRGGPAIEATIRAHRPFWNLR